MPPTPPSSPAVPSSATVTRRQPPPCRPAWRPSALGCGSRGETAPTVIGDNWYEVERSAAQHGETGMRRAAFSLDELSPSDAEFAQWMRWLELAREEVADALDATGDRTPDVDAGLRAVAAHDLSMAGELGGSADALRRRRSGGCRSTPRATRLTDALEQAGPTHDGVRRVLRLAIADDLRLADRLRGGCEAGRPRAEARAPRGGVGGAGAAARPAWHRARAAFRTRCRAALMDRWRCCRAMGPSGPC